MSLVDLESVEVNSSTIKVLYLNNPATKNSLTWEMGEEFFYTIEGLKNTNPYPRALIITGSNDIFSSGGDLTLLKSFTNKSYEENARDMVKFYNFFLSIRTLPFPVIGAINGHAIGAAFSMALACDVRVFSLESRYSFNFVKIGIHPGMGSTYFVKELFGTHAAVSLLLMAESLTGREALEKGICHDAVLSEEVLKRAMEYAINLSEDSPMALRMLKKNLYDNEKLQEMLKREAEAQAKNFTSQDFLESLAAMEQKRKPIFRDK
ncbi:MAG: enoyl-CoA hydratase/isomerase family protein [Leptospiraceae bacterium]|nr:enoyl-CoA hydratase/isomerase family protein [Leptospiraceae bacterium]MCP5497659.1 enoyl-CoA hydratase/isomerase family protein [Leptospiraceae bacterium]